jgi:Stigma-specific protein, Stig1
MATQTTERSLDELAKGLATGTLSRGKAIRWMGGALLGAALASFPGVAWADDDRCSEGQTRCGERCVNLQRNERHCGECFNRCEEGQECVEGVCSGGEPTCVSPGCSPCNCGPVGTLNQSTCTCECSPFFAGLCAGNSNPARQGCCPDAVGESCVPLGTVCSPF